MFPGDKKVWQNCPGSLITKILKHFFLSDKDSLFTLVENKLAHVYAEKSLVLVASAWLCFAQQSPQGECIMCVNYRRTGWVSAKMLEFQQPESFFQESHGTCIHSFQKFGITQKQIWASDFRIALWASLQPRPKVYVFSHSLVHSFCHSTNICEDFSLPTVVLLAKCVPID